MDRYIVLRDLNPLSARRATRHPAALPLDFSFEIATRTSRRAPADLPEPSIEAVSLPSREAQEAATRDPSVKDIARVMPTMLLAPVATAPASPAATLPAASWGIAATRADASQATGKGVTVAVLDTGIDFAHPAFQGVTLVKRDFTVDGAGSTGTAIDTHPNWDVNGHGTHCAGTIFGRDCGGTRIGIARGITRALIGKVLNDRGRGDTEWLANGLQWAINEGVDVASMSIGFDFPALVDRWMAGKGWPQKQAVSEALAGYRASLRLFDSLMAMARARAAYDEGTVIVAASGNECERAAEVFVSASMPAAADGIVSVGAVGEKAGRLEIADFSNTRPEICAPGVRIVSAKAGGGLTLMNGTSMACPHVASVAALWWEHLRGLDPDGQSSAAEVVHHMMAAARKTGVFASAYSRFDYGAGLVTAP